MGAAMTSSAMCNMMRCLGCNQSRVPDHSDKPVIGKRADPSGQSLQMLAYIAPRAPSLGTPETQDGWSWLERPMCESGAAAVSPFLCIEAGRIGRGFLPERIVHKLR